MRSVVTVPATQMAVTEDVAREVPVVMRVGIANSKLRADNRWLDRFVLANGASQSRLDRPSKKLLRGTAEGRRYRRGRERLVEDVRKTNVAARSDGSFI